ncbi:hypothetical protein OQA88_8094 [Cercophora sp. LCS_1]
MATSTSEASYIAYRDQNSKTLANIELATLALLRDKYPTHHVTLTKPSRCDLLGFAKAGHAVSTATDHSFDHFMRIYEAPRTRLEPAAGKLTDETYFSLFTYTWTTHTFLVYAVEYQDRYCRPVKLLYVLHASHPSSRTNPTTDALLLESGKWTRELHGEIYVFDNAEWKKDRELWRSVEGSSWDDVILDPDMKASLIQDVQNFFETRDLYKEMNVPWKRGVILHGIPGNGKTVSIKALINSLEKKGVPALYVKSLDACAGPKWAIQAIFQKARKMAPCLLVFEDLESMVTSKTRSYFLNEVDGLQENQGILMIGSTNYLGRLDPAITKRPSRFDRKYHFRLPDEKGRELYARYWAGKFVGNERVDFPGEVCGVVAKWTEGFSFASLKELFVASLLVLARGTHTGEVDEGVNGADPERLVENGSCVNGVNGETNEKGGDKDKKEEVKKVKTVPNVEIPESVRDNILLRIIRKQTAVLLAEMDNTEDEQQAPVASCGGDDDNDAMAAELYGMRVQMAADASV